MTRQRLWQLAHQEQGLCTKCSRPALHERTLCEYHRRPRGTKRPRWSVDKRAQFVELWNSPLTMKEIALAFQSYPDNMRSMARFLRVAKGFDLRARKEAAPL